MSGHQHDPSCNNQNLGNSLGSRSCVRQTKFYRMYESGNAMKEILGLGNLQWDTTQKQGCYQGHAILDPYDNYPGHPKQASGRQEQLGGSSSSLTSHSGPPAQPSGLLPQNDSSLGRSTRGGSNTAAGGARRDIGDSGPPGWAPRSTTLNRASRQTSSSPEDQTHSGANRGTTHRVGGGGGPQSRYPDSYQDTHHAFAPEYARPDTDYAEANEASPRYQRKSYADSSSGYRPAPTQEEPGRRYVIDKNRTEEAEEPNRRASGRGGRQAIPHSLPGIFGRAEHPENGAVGMERPRGHETRFQTTSSSYGSSR